MSATIAFDDVLVGAVIPPIRMLFNRISLVMYAGASGDFNPIHTQERIATAVGLPDVIAHGMLTMGGAGRIVTDWVGDPGAIVEYGVRFTRPVIVPDDDIGSTVDVTATVIELDPATRTATISITASYNGSTVLGRARAVVVLAGPAGPRR